MTNEKRPSIFRIYWVLYGGFSALRRSGYFLTAILIGAAGYLEWKKAGWWETTFSVVPSMLGFSLGAFAMLLSFGNDKFLEAMCVRPRPARFSSLEGTGAAFFHFLLVQSLALFCAFTAKGLFSVRIALVSDVRPFVSWPWKATINTLQEWFWCFGYVMLVYSVTCGLAASGRLLSLLLRFRQKVLADARQAEEAEQAKSSLPKITLTDGE